VGQSGPKKGSKLGGIGGAGHVDELNARVVVVKPSFALFHHLWVAVNAADKALL